MAQAHIYLCCGGGLSSGFLAQKARAAAKKGKIDATIEAKSESEVTQYLPKMDILCIGPHYEFRLNAFKDIFTLIFNHFVHIYSTNILHSANKYFALCKILVLNKN